MRSNMKIRNHDPLNVVVVGTPAMDLIAKVSALPHTDRLAIAETYGSYPGGAGANVAVGVARLGGRVGFLGTLGDDEYGQLLLRAFEDEGIDTRGVRIAKGKTSPFCFIAVGPRGERMIFALGGEALLKEVDELELTLLRGDPSVIRDGCASSRRNWGYNRSPRRRRFCFPQPRRPADIWRA